MALTFIDTHNMIAFLTKSDASEGFNQIIDILNASSIKYALTVNPNIYVSVIKQFWSSVTVKKVNDVSRLQALVDKKKVIITEATIRDALHLDDAEGIECLPNEEIFTELARMGYEKPSTKLTFYKAFFLSQWKVGKGCSGVETPLFEGMIVAQQVGEGAAKVNVEDVPAAGVTDEGAASVNDDEVPTAVDKPSIPSPTPSTQPPSTSHDIPSTSQTVKKLERSNKASKLKRLKKVGTAQRIETSDDTVMDDVSKQGRIIADMDADKDVTLKDVAVVANHVQDAEIEESSDVHGRQSESQVQIYQINLEHADKVLSMQDDEVEPVELQERKRVVIRDLEESATPSTIIYTKAKSKDNRKGILNEVIDHVQRKEKEDNAVKRYQALKRKPQTKAQARKNMMIYLRNVVGFKMDYFKGLTYDDIRPIFEKKFNFNVAFLQKTKEHMEEEDSRALKRLSESQEDKAAKKQKLDKEVEELRKHLMTVPNEDDDVYTKATPLALKVFVVDYEIYSENNKPYYKIKRAGGSHQLYLSFLSMLRNFDREDLEVLWQLVKERFSSTKTKNFSNDFLLTTIEAMFEKRDIQAQIWKNKRSVHGLAKVKSWKLLESCSVHIITFTTTQSILLVERKYPLTRFTLDQMLNNV
uniref:Xylulose kinase-1 n=1 Tax=Tanacetum cinerariifolium TaxID=118510 RepID=A0A6L2KBV3_TANCI|nr:xylulose kinase-1 [Tanacetum cinerariifolium]